MARWDPEGMRSLAGVLDASAAVLDAQGSAVHTALTAADRWLPVEGALGRVAGWARVASTDIVGRAVALEAADRTIRISLGSWGLDVDFPVGAYLDTADRIAEIEAETSLMAGIPIHVAYRAGLATKLADLRMRRLGELIVLSSTTANARYRTEASELIAALGFDRDTVSAVVEAMEAGRGHDEAGLPAVLFPPGYVAQHDREVAPILGDIVRLEEAIDRRLAHLEAVQDAMDAGASVQEIVDEFGELPLGLDIVIIDLQRDLVDARASLDDARADLSRDPFERLEWMVSLPLPPDAVHPVAGRMLADLVVDDPGTLSRVAAVLDAEASATLDQEFFDRLGSSGAAMVPTWIAMETDPSDREAATALLRDYSEALGRAAHAGLSFSGGDLVWGATTDWAQQPAELLRYGVFPDGFLVDAADTLIQVYDGFSTPFFSAGAIVFAPDFNDDPRSIVLDQLAQSPHGAAALLDRLAARHLVSGFVAPETPYGDEGWSAGRIMAAARQGDAAVAALIAAIAEVDAVESGIALGGVAMLDGNHTLVVPTGVRWDPEAGAYVGIGRFDYASDPRVGTLVTETEIDAFLKALLEHDLAAQALLHDVGRFVATEMDGAAPEHLQGIADELGAAVGRVIRIRNDVLIRRGADSDADLAFIGQLVSVLGGIAVGVATGGAGIAAGLLFGAVGDVAVDQGFAWLFPADAEVTALRNALGDDAFDLEMWRYMVVRAIWDGDPGFFGDTPPPHEIDGTLTNLWGPTIGSEECFLEEPHALEEWYAWLHSLPEDLQLAIDAIADTANSRLAEEARLRPEG